MLIFAHLGLTLAAAKLAQWVKPNLNISLFFVALGSLLPDLVDKPLGYLLFGNMGTGRIFAHTLLFFLILIMLAAILQNRNLASLSAGVFAHLLEDSMWNMPQTLFWPLMGDFVINPPRGVFDYVQALIMGLHNPGIAIPELFGFAYTCYLAYAIVSRSLKRLYL